MSLAGGTSNWCQTEHGACARVCDGNEWSTETVSDIAVNCVDVP